MSSSTAAPPSAPSSPASPMPDGAEQQPRGRRSLRIVLLTLAVGSVTLGVLAFARYRSSETYIKAELAKIEAQGRTLPVEGCIDAILAWHRRCAAMAGLCQAAVSRLMGVCFRAADRRAYCKALHQSTTDTRFGYRECKARGVKRHAKKACAGMYRVIDSHCHALRHGQPAWAKPTARSSAPVVL